MIELIKALYCIYYESICKHLKKQDILVDYKVSDGVAINKEGELIHVININVTPVLPPEYINIKMTIAPNGI